MSADQLAFDLWLERPRRVAFPAVPSTGAALTASGRRRVYVADRRGVLRLVRTITVGGSWL